MPRYFNKFPKLLYTKDNITSLVTNILARVSTVKGDVDNSALYYQYSIKEGDTPEMIASKYYGDAELHWTVLLFNNIVDPFYDWPMDYQQFIKYLADKYGSPATAQITINHYEKIVQTIDNYSGQITTNTYIIDLESYDALPAEPTSITKTIGPTTTTEIISRNAVSCYDYENNLNESKRIIRLIKKELINDIRTQFNTVMGV